MDRPYDIFEMLPDGSPLWRTAVEGHENAISKLQELAACCTNEVRVMHLASNSIVAAMNGLKSQPLNRTGGLSGSQAD